MKRVDLKMRQNLITIGLCVAAFLSITISLHAGSKIPDPYEQTLIPTVRDTFPIIDRSEDFITDERYNPFDIVPSTIDQSVEYDPETGNYIIMEKIGDEYYRSPSYLTFEEYVAYKEKQQRQQKFGQMAGITPPSKRFLKGEVEDPFSKIDVQDNLLDRLFGGTEISTEPTGNIDLTFGVDWQEIKNPFIPPRLQRQGGFDFDMDINMAVQAKIGEKMGMDFNYNTGASFDFDNKIKLAYDSEQFSEDDIIKKIEAGDVSLPLKSNLIQGAQNLFGLKTELQFGKLFVTGVASQARSEQKSLRIENGAVKREFEIRPDDYDENRHFFISHYHRDNYEQALRNLPQVRSLFRITNIEVWVAGDQSNDLFQSTTVAAISYLGESELENFSDQSPDFPPNQITPQFLLDVTGENALPENRNSDLFSELVKDDDTRSIASATTLLKTKYGMKQIDDFEVQTMRRLNSNEYTFHPQLGFISLNQRLRPNQVLGVSYEYTYTLNGDEVYKVGEITNETSSGGLDPNGEPEPEDVIFVKMLKSSTQKVNLPNWDLMMKNVYALGTSQLTEEDFKLDIFFEDNTTSTLKRFLPEDGFRNRPLLNVFGLDRLNTVGNPQPDGIFDFIPGITVNSRTGSIFFPVLEPFGKSLSDLLQNDELFMTYGFPTLYTDFITAAREQLDNNQFVIKGEMKSSVSSEISLGGFNIPQGSVTVRAGSQILQEGIDYDIDYGIGRLKIINEAFLQQGVPIDVSFEDQNLFSLQQKTMFGIRADYYANDKLSLGATYMRLFERPFTQKVNIGEDPINNRIFGLDMTYSSDAPVITNVLDKLPFFNTKEPSSINFTAEVAALKPGHSGAINAPGEDSGVVSIDDFEGANSSILLGSRPNQWFLSSTPSRFIESENADDLSYNYNRARLNWYVIDDLTARRGEDNQDPYTLLVEQTDIFQRDVPLSQRPDLYTFDMTYYPEERGPHNFDPPEGSLYSAGLDFDNEDQCVKLKNPEDRWGGIMRYLPNNDFQASNFEYIEFWMLNPFIDTRSNDGHAEGEEGSIFINLGNVSEDILKDNLQFYENSIPTPEETIPVRDTEWGRIPLSIPQVDAFDLENRREQDLGLDGLEDEGERAMYRDYVNRVKRAFPPDICVEADPSNDNFISYLDLDEFPEDANLLDRYKFYNGTQGNAPDETSRIGTGNPIPDKEDLNENRSLETSEAYYEYEIKLRNQGGEVDMDASEFITDVTTDPRDQKWYRFQIPIQDTTKAVNGIQGFRSIQFIRMYMNGFQSQKTFRLGEFELVRNQWRRLPVSCALEDVGVVPDTTASFAVNEIGIEENSRKLPFNYVSPPGIIRERVFNTFSNVFQDENALNMNICNLKENCTARMYKLTELDLRFFERVQMFVHAETDQLDLEDGDLSAFIRFGKGLDRNYYEFEIPLTFSDEERASMIADGTPEYVEEVWRVENRFDVALKLFSEVKKLRNIDKREQERNQLFKISVQELKELGIMEGDTTTNEFGNFIIQGNPSIGFIKGITIGVRNNRAAGTACAEVWVNELRMNGLNEEGGTAGLARLEIQLADLGDVTASGSFSTTGWGAIDQKVFERSLQNVSEYDVATNLNFGRFLPHKWNIQIPFYAQWSKQNIRHKFDQFELDLTPEELIDVIEIDKDEDKAKRIADVKDRNTTSTKIRTINFTNVKKERGENAKGKPKPWDISNLSFSYGHTRTEYKDEIVKSDITDDYRGGVDYNYSRSSKYIEPFKKIKSKPLRILKEFNFNPIPNSFTFSSQLRRYKNVRQFRIPETPEYVFNDQRFDWDRRYSLRWDLTKALKVNFSANNTSTIDELVQGGISDDGIAANRPYFDKFGNEVAGASKETNDNLIRENLRSGGRNVNYDHNLSVSYTLPIRYLPGMDWISIKAQYDADYLWSAGSLTLNNDKPLNSIDGVRLGNYIQNNQSRSVNATFSFDKLYDKIPYFKALDKQNSSSRRSTRSRNDPKEPTVEQPGAEGKKKSSNDGPSAIEKLLVRPLLSLRNIKFTYRENLSTAIPGVTFEPTLMGLSSGFDQPGWAFVLGRQPDVSSRVVDPLSPDVGKPIGWLKDFTDSGLITEDRFQNQQILQNNTQNYEAKVELEPWRDFKLDITFKKTFREDLAEDLVNINNPLAPDYTGADFRIRGQRFFGSFDVTYFPMRTLFNNNIRDLFQQFDRNRRIISSRLPNIDPVPNSPLLNAHETDRGYRTGLGRVQNDVVIHSFLATYSGDDPYTSSLDIYGDISKRSYIPAPNWSLRYNGLSKLNLFRDIFSSFTLTHAYKSNLQVSRFETDLQFANNLLDPGKGTFYIPEDQSQANYFARFEIPSLVISEQFAPLIGLDMKTTNEMNIAFEFKKARNLNLVTGAISQLTESRNTEYTFGLGWEIEGVDMFGAAKARARKEREDKRNAEKDEELGIIKRGKVTDNRGQILTLNLDVSFRDDVTWIHELDKGATEEPIRGLKTLRINPAVEYEMNENLTLRAFVDFSKTQPYLSTSYPITSVQGGVTARFNLN